MSKWVTRIEEHQIFETFDVLQIRLEESKLKEEVLSIDATDDLERIFNGVHYIINLLDKVEPTLIVPNWLNPLNTSLTQISNSINQFNNTSNIVHLNTANNHLDNALSQLSAIHVLATPSEVESLREVSSSFRRSCSQLIRNLESEVLQTDEASKALKAKLDELSSETVEQKKRLDEAITNFSENFNASQTKRNEEFSSLKEQSKTTFLNIIDYCQESFGNFQSKTNEQSIELQEELRNEHSTLLETVQKENSRVLEDIENYKIKAEEIVGIISMTGMVGGYQKVANQEKRAFERWRWATVISMTLLIAFGVHTFFTTVSQNFEPAVFVNRLFVTLTFVLLSGYAALQSDRHRKAEVENRRMELELASFDPFLATLSEDERNELKKKMAERIFGRHTTLNDNNEHVPNHILVELLKTLQSTGKLKS